MNAEELAKKTVLLFDMCRNMIGTNTPLSNDVSNMGKWAWISLLLY